MVGERIFRNRRIEMAKKYLSGEGYLEEMEKHRQKEEYKIIITRGMKLWKQNMEDINPMLAMMVTYENLEAEVFGSLCLEAEEFLAKTKSYTPPEEDFKNVMKIMICNFEVDAERIMEKYIENFTSCAKMFEPVFLSEL